MRPPFDLATYFAGQIFTAEAEAGLVYEPVIGLVTDNKDPEKLGRVKVKFPTLSEQDTSYWAPIIMIGAGKNRGWFFIPEKDDEVLCLFEHGDMARPLIVGALWNGKDKPHDKNPGGNPRRVIKSRAGSKITFDDDQMKLIIEDGTGKGKITFDSNGNKIIIEALVGDVAFMTPKDETKIVAKSIEIKAGTNIEIHSGKAMAWGASNVKINGSGGVTMAGSKVNLNCGNAQSPQAPTADPQDIADPYEARGQSGQAAQSQSQPAQSPPPPSSTSTTSSTPPPSSSSSQQQQQEQEQEQEEQQQDEKPKEDPHHVFVVHHELKSPAGEPLGFEKVVLVKKGTDEVVAGPSITEGDGTISFVLPNDGEFDLKIVEDEHLVIPEPVPEEHVATHLHASFGLAVAGEVATVKGNGKTFQVTLTGDGELEVSVEPGEYEVTVMDLTFKVSSMRGSDFEAGAEFHEFPSEPAQPPSNDFEKARLHRYSPSSRGES